MGSVITSLAGIMLSLGVILFPVKVKAQADIKGFDGISLGGELPKGKEWITKDNEIMKFDVFKESDPPQLRFVHVKPYLSRVGAIDESTPIPVGRLLEKWKSMLLLLTEKYGEPGVKTERLSEIFRDSPSLFETLYNQGELQLEAMWMDSDKDGIRLSVRSDASEDNVFRLDVTYIWNKYSDGESDKDKSKY